MYVRTQCTALADLCAKDFVLASPVWAHLSLPLFLTGPVRGIDFHPNQPLFVSGGDDYKIKVGSHGNWLPAICALLTT